MDNPTFKAQARSAANVIAMQSEKTSDEIYDAVVATK